jgi:hypothetical protein
LSTRRRGPRRPARSGEPQLQDGQGLPAELGERPVAVDPLAQVALGAPPDPEALADVDEQAEVDAVPADEGDRLQHLPAGGALTGERLAENGQVGKKDGDQRPGHQLGHPAAFAGPAFDRTVVVALDKGDIVPRDERAE